MMRDKGILSMRRNASILITHMSFYIHKTQKYQVVKAKHKRDADDVIRYTILCIRNFNFSNLILYSRSSIVLCIVSCRLCRTYAMPKLLRYSLPAF